MYRKALAAAQVKESDWTRLTKKRDVMLVFAARAKLLALRVRAAISNDEDADEYKSKAKVGTTFLVEWMLSGKRMTKLSGAAITNAINAGAAALEAAAGNEMDVDDEMEVDDESDEEDEGDEENLASRRNSLSQSSSSSSDSRPSKRRRTSVSSSSPFS